MSSRRRPHCRHYRSPVLPLLEGCDLRARLGRLSGSAHSACFVRRPVQADGSSQSKCWSPYVYFDDCSDISRRSAVDPSGSAFEPVADIGGPARDAPQLEKLLPMIGHIQITSVPRRAEPGTGELDDFRVFSEIDRLGYSQYIGCEYRPTGSTKADLSWLSRTKSL